MNWVELIWVEWLSELYIGYTYCICVFASSRWGVARTNWLAIGVITIVIRVIDCLSNLQSNQIINYVCQVKERKRPHEFAIRYRWTWLLDFGDFDLRMWEYSWGERRGERSSVVVPLPYDWLIDWLTVFLLLPLRPLDWPKLINVTFQLNKV